MKLTNLNPQTASDADVRGTDEYMALIKGTGETIALVACRLVLRGDFTVQHLDFAVAQAARQMQTLHTFQSQMVGKTMTWVPSWAWGGAGTNDAFVKLVVNGAMFKFVPQTTLNCWEAVLVAGMLDGQVKDLAPLKKIYTSNNQTFEHEMATKLASLAARNYNTAQQTGNPLAGDIVLFDGLAHVAMATGRRVQGPSPYGGTEIISFWPAPAIAQFQGGTQCEVAATLIEAIQHWCTTQGHNAMTVTFGSPSWQSIGS